MPTSLDIRRLLVGLVGLSSVAMVLLPGGYLDPVVAKLESTIVGPVVQAAPVDCAMDEMADMQMPMLVECASR